MGIVIVNDVNFSVDILLLKISIFFGVVNILIFLSVVIRMWQKVEYLLVIFGFIGKFIGIYFSDSNVYFVVSESKLFQFYFVYVYDIGCVICEQCLFFNDWKLCKYIIVVVEKMGRLEKVFQW